MEPGDVLTGAAIILVASLGILTLINFYNQSYGTSVGDTFNDSLDSVNTLTYSTFGGISNQVANNTIPSSGAAPSTQQESLFQKSYSTLTKLNDLMGLIPDLIGQFAVMLGIPSAYIFIAKWTFNVLFGLTIAYILLLGLKRWVGL